VRGGAYFDFFEQDLESQQRDIAYDPTGGYSGFRLAMIPEPSTLILAALGGLALLAIRRRR
jgi:hypothetical protein